jgi:uncharacterized 2Fe-2S/4Fe-4S cluster protein (DUF4445 family)
VSKSYRVTFEPIGLSTTAKPETAILASGASLDVPIRSDCGGLGLCGKCRIIAHPTKNLSTLTETEVDILSPREIAGGCRLACQASIQGPLTVTVLETLADSLETRGKTELGGSYPLDSMVERMILPKDPRSSAQRENFGDKVSWIIHRCREFTGREICIDDRDVLRQLSMPGINDGEITLVNHEQKSVTAVLSGNRKRSLGLALDLGTTTLAAYLCDLATGEVLVIAALLNPQRRFGEDIISRITRTNEDDSGLAVLHQLVIEGVNCLIELCLLKVGASQEDIDEVTAAGNTAMELIFAAFHPHGLGMFPFVPVVSKSMDFKAVELGLKLNPATPVYLFPVISGFLGGDALGVILASKPHKREENCLIVDIGTNGEIILANHSGLWATSCAMGPAFEGAQISCGMRAVSGAIDKVDIEASTGQVHYQVLGNDKSDLPIGLCGSGIIDAVAAMRRTGLLLPNGRFKEGMPGVICDDRGIGRKFLLVPAEKSATGAEITITLKDIRQIQLAKAALSVGIEFLIRKAGVTKINRTILTGAFGARFDWRSAVTIGMLPPGMQTGEVNSMDNLAGVGVVMALLDKNRRAEAAELSKQVSFMELAREPDFQTRFSQALIFPPLDGK